MTSLGIARFAAARFKIVTINILRDLSRWAERRTLLVQQLAELEPDVIALQEVSLSENTAQWLADQLGDYAVYLSPQTGKRRTREAIAILSRLPVEYHEILDLHAQYRVAQVAFMRAGSRLVVVANGHFYWWIDEAKERFRQIGLLLERLAALPKEAAIVACGDFNGTPDSKSIVFMRQYFASAYAVRHGYEPTYTCPTPLARPDGKARLSASYLLGLLLKGRLEPWRGTLDYIFVNDHLRVLGCDVVLNRPAPRDSTLYPSDHFGLAATLEMGSEMTREGQL